MKTLFSEPDIIVITEEEVIFIEVKVKASNDKQDPDKKTLIDI
ncbi:YraN family protein [Treponema zioleckii]|nr:YraN family protein [Treponema zioleckii]